MIATPTAADALAAMTRVRPDVLLSDIGMPGTDGYALIREVRRRSADEGGDVPAIALAAYFQSDDLRLAVEAGFQWHVTKPVDPDLLVSQIAALARTRQG